MTPHTVCQWFEQVPELLLEGGWNQKVDQKGALCSRKCPWGGQLLRLRAEVAVQDMPRNPAELLVRPEVRAIYGRSGPKAPGKRTRRHEDKMISLHTLYIDL